MYERRSFRNIILRGISRPGVRTYLLLLLLRVLLSYTTRNGGVSRITNVFVPYRGFRAARVT